MLAPLVAAAIALALVAPVGPQSRSGSIAGRVEGGLARRVVVALFDAPRGNRPVARTRVDAEGRYRFDGLGAGRYVVAPVAPGWVAADLEWSDGNVGRSILLAAGEEVTGVDVALVRGGVITGRVTDPDGRAVVGERIELSRLDEQGAEEFLYETPERLEMQKTDDRGIYRIYGLPPGRYLVAAGEETLGGYSMYRPGEPVRYRKAYHPATASAEAAVPVVVTSGGEVSGVDVVVGRVVRGLSASGRVVEAETGKPVPGMRVGARMVIEDEDGSGYSRASTSERTNERGEFTLENLSAGTYDATAGGRDEGWIPDPLSFTIADAPVAGLEIRVRLGASIGGRVVVEGTTDPAVLKHLTRLAILTYTVDGENDFPAVGQVQADGSFRLVGVRPGAIQLLLRPWRASSTPFTLLRIERDGAPLPGPLSVASGEEIGGVRIVVGYGTGTIRGRIEVVGGELPNGARLHAMVRNTALPTPVPAAVDARGQFLVGGLVAGEYQVEASVYIPGKRPHRATASVSVAEGTETPVAVRIDLGREGSP